MYPDTPVPQEEPAGQNPPDGAVINYYLKEKAKNVSLEILDSKGKLIRKYTNSDTLYKVGDVNIPHYWIRPQQILSANAGSHRFMWDMKYAPVNVPPAYPISATYMNTEPDQTAPWVMPGTYTARLTVDARPDDTVGRGKIQSQTFTVKMDPRVKTSTAALQQQHDLSVQCYENRKECMKLKEEIRQYKMKEPNQPVKEIETLQAGFSRLMNAFASVHAALQESDMPATTQQISAVKDLQQQFIELKKKWIEFKKM